MTERRILRLITAALMSATAVLAAAPTSDSQPGTSSERMATVGLFAQASRPGRHLVPGTVTPVSVTYGRTGESQTSTAELTSNARSRTPGSGKHDSNPAKNSGAWQLTTTNSSEVRLKPTGSSPPSAPRGSHRVKLGFTAKDGFTFTGIRHTAHTATHCDVSSRDIGCDWDSQRLTDTPPITLTPKVTAHSMAPSG